MEKDSPIIAPSILACDFGNLAAECRAAQEAGADWLHLDVMDGHFVPNISFGPAIVKAVHDLSLGLPLDVHLMIERPDRYLEDFVDAGSNLISVQVEAPVEISQTLRRIREAGCRGGLVINPPTAFSKIEPFLDQIDLLLVMTVNPGFGGQSFMEDCVEKIRRAQVLRERNAWDFRIEVDGGIKPETARICAEAGADTFVAGTSVFGREDYRAAIRALRESASAT